MKRGLSTILDKPLYYNIGLLRRHGTSSVSPQQLRAETDQSGSVAEREPEPTGHDKLGSDDDAIQNGPDDKKAYNLVIQ